METRAESPQTSQRLDPREYSFHAAYLRMLCALVREFGGDLDAVLADAGTGWAELKDAEDLLPLALGQRLVRAVHRLVPRPTLALELGSRTPVSSHGPLGYALASSANLRQALEVLGRFTCIRTLAVREYGEIEPGGAWLVIEPVIDLGDVRAFVIDHIVAAKSSMLSTLSGMSLDQVILELPWQSPPWHAAYQRCAGQVRFGARRAALWIPNEMLDAPCATASPSVFASACRECEQEQRRQLARATLSGRILVMLRELSVAEHRVAHVARRLGCSARTLNRRLQAEDSSFRLLSDRERRRRAHLLLTQTRQDMKAVAASLGYTDAANLRRSCYRWFGVPPSVLRAQRQA
jgi:AraC-like DNA-binding protein